MNAEFTRDAAAAAAVLAFFASSWFGWAQDRPPGMWWIPLIAGSVLSLLVAAAGAVLAWRHWSDPTGFDADTACSASSWVSSSQLPVWGAVVLARRRRSDLIPAWAALVVGVHLFPLAPLLAHPLLFLTAALVTMAAIAAIPLARARSLPVSAVTGVATGTILLATAVYSLA